MALGQNGGREVEGQRKVLPFGYMLKVWQAEFTDGRGAWRSRRQVPEFWAKQSDRSCPFLRWGKIYEKENWWKKSKFLFQTSS